ncbi:hypothetical protein VTO42DRAFT_3976 [Malbranchea cinnamomea]
MENSIIPLYVPGDSFHLLQPLDVGCYSPLKQIYKKEVEKQMRLGINHIDKDEFLTIYSSVRPAVLSEKTFRVVSELQDWFHMIQSKFLPSSTLIWIHQLLQGFLIALNSIASVLALWLPRESQNRPPPPACLRKVNGLKPMTHISSHPRRQSSASAGVE